MNELDRMLSERESQLNINEKKEISSKEIKNILNPFIKEFDTINFCSISSTNVLNIPQVKKENGFRRRSKKVGFVSEKVKSSYDI